MKVLLDMDGVLTDFVQAMCVAHRRANPYTHPSPHIRDKALGCFDLDKLWSMSAKEFWSVADENFWENIPPSEECFEIISVLEHTFAKQNICLLSSPSQNLGCIPGKIKWIRKHIPEYSKRFLFGNRKEFCSANSHILIDDKDKNIDTFRLHKGMTFLFPRLWNSRYDEAQDPVKRLKYVVGFMRKYYV